MFFTYLTKREHHKISCKMLLEPFVVVILCFKCMSKRIADFVHFQSYSGLLSYKDLQEAVGSSL